MTQAQAPTRDSTPGDPSALDATFDWAGRGVTALLKARKRLVAYVLVGTAAAVAIALSIPNQYASTAAFIVQGSATGGLPVALQSAAASLGLDKGNDYSPKFYADLLSSRPVLSSAILHQYRVPVGDSSAVKTYVQIARFDDASPPIALENAIKDLSRRVSASADVRTNLITVSVRTRYPSLSRDLLTQLLAALDSLNVGFRQFQSRESRQFYETRVQQSRSELDSAEGAVRRFLQQNRVSSSPALQFELQRLQRESDLKRGVYQIVVQQYEQARLQEARNVPTLTVLAEPFIPVKKSYPPRRLIVVLGVLVSIMILWTQLTFGEALGRFSKDNPEHWEVLSQQIPAIRRLVGRT